MEIFRIRGFTVLSVAAAASWAVWSAGASPRQAPVPAPPEPAVIAFRVIFGANRQAGADYSGSVSLSQGSVSRVYPWRFFGADSITGPTSWKVEIKRAVFENQPDRPNPMGSAAPQNLVPAGISVIAAAPPSAVARIRTASGDFETPIRDLGYGRPIRFRDGDVLVERTAPVERLSEPDGMRPPEEHDYPSLAVTHDGAVWTAWQAYCDRGDHVYARYSTAAGWSAVMRITEQRGDIFRTAIQEDASGAIWVVWSERTGAEWHLYARIFRQGRWSPRRQLTSADAPNLFHRLVRDAQGGLHLVWTGWRQGRSRVLWSRLSESGAIQPADLSGDGAWAPDATAAPDGSLYVVWDSYRTGNYDIFLRRVGPDGQAGPIWQVTRSARFQAHPSLAVDPQGRVWLAWDESGPNWGKDWSREDTWRGTTLYADRQVRVAVLAGGAWSQPADLMGAVPEPYRRYVQLPRLICDRRGRLWAQLQVRTSTQHNRADGWAFNGRWERFLTSLEGDRWMPAMPLVETSSRPEGPFEMAAGPSRIWMVWTNDNRPFRGPGGLGGAWGVNEIFAGWFAFDTPPPPARLERFEEPTAPAEAVHPDEAEAVRRLRAYRVRIDGTEYRILRGDFHRHTEISADGAGDGSIEDYFRYMLDAAEMDTGIIADHNAGGDNEYTWWRTEKAIDLFHIPGRFTPLFGYERSVAYPNGHRNVVFPERGVRTLPIGEDEQKARINSGAVLYPYLKQHRGIAMLHSLATAQGSDYRDNDPEVEPLVELYQGYHANYEYEGAPRAETREFAVRVHGTYQPEGFYWNALAKGYKLGVQASSDHISTHSSYTMIYTPSADRSSIVESMRRRRTYGATDNILLDVRALDPAGGVHMMGDAFEASGAIRLAVQVHGTAPVASLEVIKNNRFVYRTNPMTPKAEVTYTDQDFQPGESYYYVRIRQSDRNLAWSSPVWVNYTGR